MISHAEKFGVLISKMVSHGTLCQKVRGKGPSEARDSADGHTMDGPTLLKRHIAVCGRCLVGSDVNIV